MTDAEMISAADRYLAGIDLRDPSLVRDVLAEGCVLKIETHGTEITGRDAIIAMFARRWDRGIHTLHHDIVHVPSAASGRLACQFRVTYMGPEAPAPKSNATVFSFARGRIARIEIYMSGPASITS